MEKASKVKDRMDSTMRQFMFAINKLTKEKNGTTILKDVGLSFYPGCIPGSPISVTGGRRCFTGVVP